VAPGSFPLYAAGHVTLPESSLGNLRWVEADGQINIWLDFSNGLLGTQEASRIRDALAVLNSFSVQAGGPALVEVFDASRADVRISMQPGTMLGGPGAGVLATTQVAFSPMPAGTLANGEPFHRILGHDFGMLSQVSFVAGWNWYTGADPSGIAADQYDLQSVAAHELGHILGLRDQSTDWTSAMFESLAAGQIRRSYGSADAALLGQLYAEGAVLDASPGVALPAPAPVGDDAMVYAMVNSPTGTSRGSAKGKAAEPARNTPAMPPRRNRQQAVTDMVFAAGTRVKKPAKARMASLQTPWWTGLSA